MPGKRAAPATRAPCLTASLSGADTPAKSALTIGERASYPSRWIGRERISNKQKARERMMHRTRRLAAQALVPVFLIFCNISCGGEIVTEPDETEDEPITLDGASICHYTVTGNGVALRESPNVNSVRRQLKNRGDRVSGPCRHASGSGFVWHAIYCNCARDGIGWMVHLYLDP